MDKTLAARRLSAAIGQEIRPSMIERATDRGLVKLTNGGGFCLAGGNAVYVGARYGDDDDDYQEPFWIRNGKRWDPQPDERIRPLPGQTKHIFDFD